MMDIWGFTIAIVNDTLLIPDMLQSIEMCHCNFQLLWMHLLTTSDNSQIWAAKEVGFEDTVEDCTIFNACYDLFLTSLAESDPGLSLCGFE